MEQKNSRSAQARINGARSNGPKTPEGLERCRTASIKHGAFVAAVAVLPSEDPLQYEGMWHSLIDQYKPRNIAELAIVASILDAIWRQRRLSRAANHEIQMRMRSIRHDSTMECQSEDDIHLRAEVESETVARLETRARFYSREIVRLQKILDHMQSKTVSSEASQMSNEILELTAEKVERKLAEREAARQIEPQPPSKRPPQPEIQPRKGEKPLRR